MSNLNIQWKLGKPLGVLAILAGFALLTQLPIIYHAREILKVISSQYLAAYITITIAAVFIIANAEIILYEALLVRLRSYDIKDYRAPFISATAITVVYYLCYYITFAILNGVDLFTILNPVEQYALCQIVGLVLIMLISFWYNTRQSRVYGTAASRE